MEVFNDNSYAHTNGPHAPRTWEDDWEYQEFMEQQPDIYNSGATEVCPSCGCVYHGLGPQCTYCSNLSQTPDD